jgi:hypothetical protein
MCCTYSEGQPLFVHDFEINPHNVGKSFSFRLPTRPSLRKNSLYSDWFPASITAIGLLVYLNLADAKFSSDEQCPSVVQGSSLILQDKDSPSGAHALTRTGDTHCFTCLLVSVPSSATCNY